ncbi:MAG TPA: NUDIX hydrolase [Marinilabiliales bacterium]|nr:NUDIX hydrolase [Marinilabiliales bacterium]HBX84435.1 NUDIX hydrolase [Marinilabiliales bacterium]HCC31785.1 NUDIX hydrolase [Marinilabiliales bacterium]
MNKKELLLKLLPGILPILIFIAVDEIWGTKAGLIVAIAFGASELAFLWIKDKRFDKFVLFDTLLLVALGGVSILLDNDAFFKLKPGIIGVIFCLMLGFSAFSPRNFLFDMSKRYMKGVDFNKQQQQQFTQSLKILFYITVFHTVLVFYSVWYLPKEAWAFISGGLLYILIGAWFLFEFVKKRWQIKKLASVEWLPLVDEQGKIVGKATREEAHLHKEWLHPVVHLHVLNSKGEWYLQKRPMHKKIQPGKWDTAVGGHVGWGERIEDSLKRETMEEIGIVQFVPELVLKYVWKSEVESELVFCFITRFDGTLIPHPQELDGGKFWKLEELKQSMGKGLFTPNFEHEFQLLIQNFRKAKAK